MNYSEVVVLAAVSYLLGSIPFGYLLVRAFQGIDVRSIGSGNIGATNVARTGGKRLALVTLGLDCLKGWLPVFVILHCPRLAPETLTLHTLAALAALMAVVGHMFTVWLRFRGGKGVATGLGVFLALAPRAIGVALLCFLLIVFATRYVSLGSMVAAAVFPIALWFFERAQFSASALTMCVAVSLLIIVRHHQNISRLLAGKESRWGARKA